MQSDVKMTAGQRISNLWYHYKWRILLLLFAVVAIAVCMVQCLSKTDPDQMALLYLNETVSASREEALEAALAQYITDKNGDGTVMYEVLNTSYNAQSDVQYAQTNNSRMMAEIVSGEVALFIVDANGYHHFMQDNLNLFDTCDFMNDQDGHAWNWKGSALQTELAGQFPEDMYFCLRRVEGTAVEGKKQAQTARADAENLLRTLAE